VNQETKHRLEVVQRKEIRVDGVQHVESYTEEEIVIDTNMGVIVLVGDGLNITQLDLQTGGLQVNGFINGIQYQETGTRKSRRGRNILGRILK
jgi:sporulation protein YabP